MASAPVDWSPMEKTLVESAEGGRYSQLPSFAMINPCSTESWGEEDRLCV